MGVKSTVTLSRTQAEERCIDHYLQQQIPTLKEAIRQSVILLSNSDLEDTLEHLNDESHDGEGFENYCIQ